MFSLNKILNFESTTKCSFKQYLHKEARSEGVVEDAMFILSYILSFWAIWDLISKQHTTEAQQKYTRAHYVKKKKTHPPKKNNQKQRKSKPKLIVDKKGVILLFLEPPSPNKNQNKNPQPFCGWLLWEVEYTIYKQTHPYHKNISHQKGIYKARCGRTCL